MTDTNMTDDTEARAFEAGLRKRMRWDEDSLGLWSLFIGRIKIGEIWKQGPGDAPWRADPRCDVDGPIWGRDTNHPTRESAQAALVDAAVAAIMGDGA